MPEEWVEAWQAWALKENLHAPYDVADVKDTFRGGWNARDDAIKELIEAGNAARQFLYEHRDNPIVTRLRVALGKVRGK